VAPRRSGASPLVASRLGHSNLTNLGKQGIVAHACARSDASFGVDLDQFSKAPGLYLLHVGSLRRNRTRVHDHKKRVS
jgi:hypothetical protein